MKGLAHPLLRRPPLRRRTRRKSVTPRLGPPSPVRRDPQRVVILGAHHPGLARWQKPHCHATTTTNAPFRGADRSVFTSTMAAMGLAQLLPALVSGVDQVAGRARYRLRHLRSRGAPRSCYAVERDAEEAPRVRPVGGRRSDRRRVPDLCLENVGDGLAGGVVHPDGVPVAMDVRHESRGRDSRQFASDKRTRLFAPPSVVAEGVLKVDRALTHASTVLVTSDRRPAAAGLPSSVAPHPLMRRSTCLLTVWVPPATSTFSRASPEGSRRSSRAREGQGRARSRRGKGGVHQRSQRYVSAG